jgi:hypothetical protein
VATSMILLDPGCASHARTALGSPPLLPLRPLDVLFQTFVPIVSFAGLAWVCDLVIVAGIAVTDVASPRGIGAFAVRGVDKLAARAA